MTSCPDAGATAVFFDEHLDARKNMTMDDVIEDDEEFIQLLFSMTQRRSDGSCPMSMTDASEGTTSSCSQQGSVDDCCSESKKELMTNIGSLEHAKDPMTCKSIPCSYYQKPGGCKLGHFCKFCHICLPLTRKQIVEFNKKRRTKEEK